MDPPSDDRSDRTASQRAQNRSLFRTLSPLIFMLLLIVLFYGLVVLIIAGAVYAYGLWGAALVLLFLLGFQIVLFKLFSDARGNSLQ